MFSAIVAVDKNNAIGYKGDMLFHLPHNLKYFRKTTMGHPIVMGRKTYESIGHPLDGRENIIITRDKQLANKYKDLNMTVYDNIQEIIDKYKDSEEEVFIIGGDEIYKQFFNYCNKLYITKVYAIAREADSYFPKFDEKEWKSIYRDITVYPDSIYECRDFIYERKDKNGR